MGYRIFCDGKLIGGAATNGTPTRTSDGRIRHWRNIRQDTLEHAATAKALCVELAAGLPFDPAGFGYHLLGRIS